MQPPTLPLEPVSDPLPVLGGSVPLEPNVLLVPRWPTNLFATPTTPADMMDAYNLVYGPNGTSPYFSRDLTYSEHLDFEADIALYHLVSGSPYQPYQHVGNLREYAPGRSLAFDWTERLLANYSRYYDRPVLTLSPDALGRAVAERTSFRRSGVRDPRRSGQDRERDLGGRRHALPDGRPERHGYENNAGTG